MMRKERFFGPNKTFSKDLSTGALSYTSDYPWPVKIEMVRGREINDVGITEVVRIYIVSLDGNEYLQKTINLSNATDFRWEPDGDVFLRATDQLKVTCTNANTTGDLEGEIITSEA